MNSKKLLFWCIGVFVFLWIAIGVYNYVFTIEMK